MSVYVLTAGWHYEGFEILGIYSSQEKAVAAKKMFTENSDYAYMYDSIEIREFELNNHYLFE